MTIKLYANLISSPAALPSGRLSSRPQPERPHPGVARRRLLALRGQRYHAVPGREERLDGPVPGRRAGPRQGEPVSALAPHERAPHHAQGDTGVASQAVRSHGEVPGQGLCGRDGPTHDRRYRRLLRVRAGGVHGHLRLFQAPQARGLAQAHEVGAPPRRDASASGRVPYQLGAQDQGRRQFMTLKLYANLVSQPSRAVEWVMRLKNLEHVLVLTEFGSRTFTSAEFLALNPNGFIPVLQDGDFALFESSAIMVYLAEKFGWTDLYPKDIQAHAKVNEYLHWHHTNARLITMKVLVPLKRIKQNKQLQDDVVLVKEAPTLIAKLLKLVEKFLVKDFIAGTDTPTLADFVAYCEFVQIELMGSSN
ncbi:Thioredoxin-like fold [Phytophthora cactorum]|nr:Thioredoxin-like fold [Phytophthora cactorum]